MKIEISPVTLDQALQFAVLMREPDRRVCADFLGMTPEATIAYLFRKSILQRQATVDGDPAALWGVQPQSILGDSAAPWMMTAAAAARAPVTLIKTAIRELREYGHIWPRLLDAVIDGDVRSLRAVRLMGFISTEQKVHLSGRSITFFRWGGP